MHAHVLRALAVCDGDDPVTVVSEARRLNFNALSFAGSNLTSREDWQGVAGKAGLAWLGDVSISSPASSPIDPRRPAPSSPADGRLFSSPDSFSARIWPSDARQRIAHIRLAAIQRAPFVLPHGYQHISTDIDASLDEALLGVNHLLASGQWWGAGIAAERLSGRGEPVEIWRRTDKPDAREARAALLAFANLGSESRPIPPAVWRRSLGEFEAIACITCSCADPAKPLAPFEVRLISAVRLDLASRSLGARPINAIAKPRVVIQNLAPSVDGGRFAVKAVAGDIISVEADIFIDGHEVIRARLLSRAEGETEWRESAMKALVNDRWSGSFVPGGVGRYQYKIQAWLDVWGTFARDLAKKAEAKVDVALELREGMSLVADAQSRLTGRHARTIADALARFRRADDAEKVAILRAMDLHAAMDAADERAFAVESFVQAIDVERREARFASWYELFPRSQTDDVHRPGRLLDVVPRLPAIAAMGFDVLYFTPIHPIGRTNRKGPNNTLIAGQDDPGSPYAIGSAAGGHDAVHPDLGTLDDFRALLEAARGHGLEIALDFAIQCSPDHPWLKEHPGWFAWRPDGTIKYAENPPKKYQDIVNVDFYAAEAQPALWEALRDVVLFWVKQGIRTFRVDNPHTKPLPFWEWMIGEVRATHPDVIFLSEAFTRPKMMYHLAKVGFSQSYTYFTWRHTKAEFTEYLTELNTTAPRDFFRPHFFVNTPDINPYFLQTSGRPGFLIRAALAATLSGLWGMYSGFELCESEPLPGKEEYKDSEKFQIRVRDWNAPGSITAEITRLNAIRRGEPALQTHLGLTFYNAFNDQVLYFGKQAPGEQGKVLVAISLDPHRAQSASFEVPLWEYGLGDDGSVDVIDLLSDMRSRWTGKIQTVHLTPEAPYAIWRILPAETGR